MQGGNVALFGPPNIDRLISHQDIPGLIRATEYERDADVRLQAVEALGLMPDEQSLAPLIRRLLDNDRAVRQAAARALGQIGDPRAIDALAAVIEGEQEDLSPAAIEALGHIGTAEAVPTLILCLSDEALVDVAVEALARAGAPAVVPLMNIIAGKDEALKEAAERALHGMDPQAALDLSPLVNDRKSMERFVAARALGEIGNEEAISVLVAALGSTDIQLQPHVLAGLARIGTRAIGPLVAALESESRLQQRNAIEALGRLADPLAAGPLAQVIAGRNPVLRDLAMQALARIPDEAALESIVGYLHHESWSARRQVATALGMANRKDGIPALLTLLTDENAAVRRSAAASLGQLGWRPDDTTDPAAAASYAVALGHWTGIEAYGEAAIAPLIASLADNTWEQRRPPTEMLISIGEAAVEPLIEALSSTDRNVRHSAAFALGRLGDARAVQPLIGQMSDNIDEVRAACARSLGQLGDPAAVAVLAEHLSDVVSVRGPAADALLRMGDAGLAVLLEALESEEAGVRSVVADVLGNAASPEAVTALIPHLTDESEAVRQATIRGLVHLDDLAVEPLYEHLDDEDEVVRVSIAAIFGQIDRPECVPALYTFVRDEAEPVMLAGAAALEKMWLSRASTSEPLGNVSGMYVMTFTDAPEDDDLQSFLISEAFGDLTGARPDLQRVHTRMMVDQSLLHERHEAAADYEYAYGPMYNQFMSWVEEEGGDIEDWEARFYHREIGTGDERPEIHYVYLYYAGGPEPKAPEEESEVDLDEGSDMPADDPDVGQDAEDRAEADPDEIS